MDDLIKQCAAVIKAADGLLITAGAGMGVDSGLPNFRGKHGFWKVYPGLGNRGIAFKQIAQPESFHKQPKTAWGFYGHRLNLYRNTQPHAGFQILKEIADSLPQGGFVFTSNVDGQFQKAGFSDQQVFECHGSIHYLQCLTPCANSLIWPADEFMPIIDEKACRLTSPLPCCPHCGETARPNILMFNDLGWLDIRSERKQPALDAWLKKCQKLVVIEIGAGTDIPTVRRFSEKQRNATLIRINTEESRIAGGSGIELALSGMETLMLISQFIKN